MSVNDTQGGASASTQQETLEVHVVNAHGAVTKFRVKKNAPLKKIFNAYCQKHNLQIGTARFVFDGTRLSPEDTPGGLEMEDRDQIEVYMEAVGGGNASY